MNSQEITYKMNRKVMGASVILILFAIFGYVLEYIKGNRTMTYVLLLSLAVAFPLLISFIVFKIPKQVENFKYVALYSFLVSWALMLFFSPKVVQFVLIFPLLMIYVLYFNARLLAFAGLIMNIVGIAKVVLNITYYKMTDSFIFTSYTVFILSMLLFSIFAVSTTKFSVQIRNKQLQSIMDEEEKNEALLGEVMEILKVMSETSQNVSNIYEELIDTSNLASETIDQLSTGMKGIADNLSNQSGNTQNMQEKLRLTSGLSGKVSKQADVSSEAIDSGKKTIEALSSSAETVDNNNEHMYKTINDLSEKSGEIKDFVEILRSIATQTNLLALNASIESARAGEAGKGFSVVAEAIRELSIQTEDALTNIGELIGSLEDSASQSLEAATQTKELASVQQELIKNSRQVFDTVSNSVNLVNESITASSQMNDEIVSSNESVVSSISEIAGVVQEAADNSEKTSKMVSTNKTLTLKAKSYMDELNSVVKSIEKYTV